jgi:iron(III) transport system permease protein
MASLETLVWVRPRRWRVPNPQSAIGWALLALLAILVLCPIGLLLVNSFQMERPGQAPAFGLEGWRIALTEPGVLTSIWNTAAVTVAVQAISLPLAIALAWLIARTDLPGAGWVNFLLWVSFFVPSLGVTLGWILLLDPSYGLVNQWFVQSGLFRTPPLNIYSFWGIVFVHVTGPSLTLKTILLVPAFRNMDANLEAAARASGASPVQTMLRVIVPIMTPAILAALLLSTIRTLEAFEVEWILGLPTRFYVYSTMIYQFVRQEPAQFGAATALSVLMLVAIVPLILSQHWLSHRRSFTTVTGRFQNTRVQLRGWRWPLFALVVLVLLVVTFLPLVFLLLGSFMTIFGFFNLPQPWTLNHWQTVLSSHVLVGALTNTVVMGASAALVSVVACFVIAYYIARTRFAGRAALDFLTWLPYALPGIILGMGLLWFVLSAPFLRPLYGSLGVLVLVSVLTSMTLAVQLFKSTLLQLGPEIEEAAHTSGATWWETARHILVPILSPSMVVVAVMTFVAAARAVSTIAMLVTGQTAPLAIVQLEYMALGDYGSASVLGALVVLLSIGVAFLARALGFRVGPGAQ